MDRFAFGILFVLFGATGVFAAAAADFDGDGKSDRVVVRKEAGSGRFGPLVWYIHRSSDGQTRAVQWGYGEDRLVAADYDGDGKTDVAVWRSDENDACVGGVCQAHFYILRSGDGGVTAMPFGARIMAWSDQARANIPFVDDPTVVADYDGDGKADVAVYREGANAGDRSWLYYLPSSNPAGGIAFVPWGVRGDDPCPPGDYDGDGKADPCVRRGYGKNPATFHILQGTAGYSAITYGYGSDQMVNADYDGDGKTDLAVMRAEEIVSAAPPISWFIRTADGNFTAVTFGIGGEFGDKPLIGDYDGDGKSDVAVLRPKEISVNNTSVFYTYNSAGFGGFQWGLPDDKPVNSTGYLSKLPAGWTVMYDKLGSGAQGWGFLQQVALGSSYSLPSMNSYSVSATKLIKGDMNKFIRRAEFAARVFTNGVDAGNLVNAAGYALRVWNGNSSQNFFANPLLGGVANHQTIGNFTFPNLGDVSTPVYVSPSGSNRPFYVGWSNIDISLADIVNTQVSMQIGIDALSGIGDTFAYTSLFRVEGDGSMNATSSGAQANVGVPLAHRLITSE